MKIKTLITLPILVLFAGCISTPKATMFDGQMVQTYSVSAGCKDLNLDQDCGMSGAKKHIQINSNELRISGGDGGRVVFIMAKPVWSFDQESLQSGALDIKNFLSSKGVSVLETKVMYSNNTLAGVHYTLDLDGYSLLQELATE